MTHSDVVLELGDGVLYLYSSPGMVQDRPANTVEIRRRVDCGTGWVEITFKGELRESVRHWIERTLLDRQLLQVRYVLGDGRASDGAFAIAKFDELEPRLWPRISALLVSDGEPPETLLAELEHYYGPREVGLWV